MLFFKRSSAVSRYYKITKFYEFLKHLTIKTTISIAVFLTIYLVLDYYILDTEAILTWLVSNTSLTFVLISLYLSESFLGLLPIDLYIAWAAKMDKAWLYLTILSVVSYIGGITAYLSGKLIFLIPSVKNHFENNITAHIANLRKWGGVLIFVGAMLPIPMAMVSLACGLINFSFKQYLLWALFRFARFGLYALVIFELV